MLILLITVACLWAYGIIVHREPAYGSLAPRAHVLEYRSNGPSTPEVVAPDMNSDAVRHANADVLGQLQITEQKLEPNREKKFEPNKAKHGAAPHRKKKATVIARGPLKPWMQTYAWGPRTFQVPFGRY
jgi:hypothetical protein